MKHILITSMLALGVGCGAAAAQTQPTEAKPGADANCAAGTANCQKGSKMKMGEQAQGKAKVQTDEQAQGKAGATTDQQAQGKTSTQTDQGSTASITNVTVEQKTQITQVIKETRVEPVSNVDFDISVGIEIPRHKIRLHRLPARIVKIVPAYETYEYFVLADGRIVIVDPDTLKIVLILT